MFLLRGTRKIRIKTFHYHGRPCESCKDFDLSVKVYKDYFHIFFLPIFATGIKSSAITCNNCGSPIRSDSLSKEFESKARIPFYLYSGLILVGLFAITAVFASLWGQHERSKYIADPKVGDVYLIKYEQSGLSGFSFLLVKKIDGDSVVACQNHVMYLESASAFNPDDYFDSSQVVGYTKLRIKEQFEKGYISSVFRDYDETTGFNRIR